MVLICYRNTYHMLEDKKNKIMIGPDNKTKTLRIFQYQKVKRVYHGVILQEKEKKKISKELHYKYELNVRLLSLVDF